MGISHKLKIFGSSYHTHQKKRTFTNMINIIANKKERRLNFCENSTFDSR